MAIYGTNEIFLPAVAAAAVSLKGPRHLLRGMTVRGAPVAEEAGAVSNRCQSTVGKNLSALAPKADMPHRQQRLTDRAGKGPGSIRHGRLPRVDVEIRSLSFVWAVGTWRRRRL
jgi:hypothetical protein